MKTLKNSLKKYLSKVKNLKALLEDLIHWMKNNFLYQPTTSPLKRNKTIIFHCDTPFIHLLIEVLTH